MQSEESIHRAEDFLDPDDSAFETNLRNVKRGEIFTIQRPETVELGKNSSEIRRSRIGYILCCGAIAAASLFLFVLIVICAVLFYAKIK